MEGQRDRFKDAVWAQNEKNIRCLIGGAGGIGSWLSFFLARIGYSLFIYDFDTIETLNLSGQLFSKKQIGLLKVDAIANLIEEFSNEQITPINEKFTIDSMGDKFMFSGFDNMKARQDMFEVWVNTNKDEPDAIFIDGRLSLEQIQIFCVTKNTIDEYRKYLFDDEEVAETTCTLKQTSHTAAMIAAQMTVFFTNHIVNIREKNRDRSVPFSYEYFSPLHLHTEPK